MPFQEFVSSGFGLWTPDCNNDTHVKGVRKQRRQCDSSVSSQQMNEDDGSVKSEERQSKQKRRQEVSEDRDLEDMALSLVESRNDMIKHLAKSEKAMKQLEAENEKIRAENEKLKADNEKWKSHVEKMITDIRISLEEIRRQSSETVRLQNENEKLRNENKYRHLLMQQMKKRSEMEAKKKKASAFGMISPCG